MPRLRVRRSSLTRHIARLAATAPSPRFSRTGKARCWPKPIYEWSTFTAGTASGTDLAVYGDFQNYLIAERLGMTVEIVQHVLGSNRRPIGARGLYAYGRTGGSATVPNAFRWLEVS